MYKLSLVHLPKRTSYTTQSSQTRSFNCRYPSCTFFVPSGDTSRRGVTSSRSLCWLAGSLASNQSVQDNPEAVVSCPAPRNVNYRIARSLISFAGTGTMSTLTTWSIISASLIVYDRVPRAPPTDFCWGF